MKIFGAVASELRRHHRLIRIVLLSQHRVNSNCKKKKKAPSVSYQVNMVGFALAENMFSF